MQAHRCAFWDLLARESRHLEKETGYRQEKRAPMERKRMFVLDVAGGSRWQGISKGC